MTKKEAASKVLKLLRLSKRAGTPEEAESAKRKADEFIAKFALTPDDLQAGVITDAFDDLVGKLDTFAQQNQNQLPGAVLTVLDSIKRNCTSDDKRKVLSTVVHGSRLAFMMFGHNKYVSSLKGIIETTLKKHEVTI